jgi:hypothetical protein
MDRESQRPPNRPDETPADTQESRGEDPSTSTRERDTDPSTGPSEPEGGSPDEEGGPLPDIIRKALAMGFTGFFSTEQTIRKALGDTLPKDWIDFVADQSERTRGDFTDAIAQEVGRSLQTIDLTQIADQLLTGRTVEVSARIRLLPLDDKDTEPEERDT